MRSQTHRPDARPVWNRTIARPVAFAGSLVLAVAFLSLLTLAYLSYSSSRRLDPLEAHLRHLRSLQEVNVEVQDALVADIRHRAPDQAESIAQISLHLRNMLRGSGYLHRDTPRRILAAQTFLLRDGYTREENLSAAFKVLQQTLRDENQVQRTVVAQSRRSARSEFVVAIIALVLVPLVLLGVLLVARRRFLMLSSSLSTMLENVRASNLDPVALPPPDEPFFPVIERYNAMVERLREIEAEHVDRQHALEHQVQVASDSLLRVQHSLAQAEQLSAIGEVSARIAHELRNPLSGIIMALRNLQAGGLGATQAETVALVLAELARVDRLLTDLLARTPREREAPVPTRVLGLCNDMIALFGHETRARIRFGIDVPDGVCWLARDTLRQVVLNLLRNSAQAMGPDGGTIRLSGTRTDDGLALVIEDSGPGYPDDILNSGIRPFHSGKPGGAGIGLSIVQRLVGQAGGRLRLQNASGGGARTTIEMPCRAAAAGEEATLT